MADVIERRRLEMLVRRDAASVIGRIERSGESQRGLFIDCGSNVGQGLTYFARYFPPTHFDYRLIEPNPNCAQLLERTILPRYPPEQIRLVAAADATASGRAQLYGLTEDARGPLSDGASISRDHNSAMYEVDEVSALTVATFSFSEFVRSEAVGRPAVVVKMDIEAAEYEVLRDMLAAETAGLVTLLFVEFHSVFMREPERTAFGSIERELLDELRARGVVVRLWK